MEKKYFNFLIYKVKILKTKNKLRQAGRYKVTKRKAGRPVTNRWQIGGKLEIK